METQHERLVDEEPTHDLHRDVRACVEVGRGEYLPHAASTDQRVDAEPILQVVARFDRHVTVRSVSVRSALAKLAFQDLSGGIPGQYVEKNEVASQSQFRSSR